MCCENCDRIDGELSFYKTAYGDNLCEDCWDDYICTDAGMLEYFIGICKGDYPAEEFDADFLGSAVRSYQNNCNKLDLTEAQKFELENKAKELGLL